MWSVSVHPAAAEADLVINNMHQFYRGVGPQVEGRESVCFFRVTGVFVYLESV